MGGRRDERSGDFSNIRQGRDFVRRDERENFGAFGNGGILGEKPVEFFSDFGGQYQGQGNRRGEMMNRGGRVTENLEREFMGNGGGGGGTGRFGQSANSMGGGMGMGGGGGYPQMEEFGMREAMLEADQRMELKRRQEMEREAARFNSSGYGDTGVTFGGRGGGRRGSFDQGQYRGGGGQYGGVGGRRGSFDDQEDVGMGFDNGRRAYDGGFGGSQMGGGMMGGAKGNMGDMGQQYGRGMGGGLSLPPPHPSIGGGVRGSDGLVRSTAGVMGKAGGVGGGRYGESDYGMGGGMGEQMGMGGRMGMGRHMGGGPLEMLMGGDERGGNSMGGGRQQGQDMDFRGRGSDSR